MRFTAGRKEMLVKDHLAGRDISKSLDLFQISKDEFSAWLRHYKTAGRLGLRQTHIKSIRKMENKDAVV